VSEPGAAVEWFRETLKTAAKPEQEALRYGLALALTDAGRAAEARPILEELLEQAPDVSYYHVALADAEFRADDTDAAIARYQRAMQVFPGSVAVTLAYSQALLYLGRGREALTHLVA